VIDSISECDVREGPGRTFAPVGSCRRGDCANHRVARAIGKWLVKSKWTDGTGKVGLVSRWASNANSGNRGS